MTGRQNEPLCLPFLHQAPELCDGHLDRAILSLFYKELVVLADRDLFRPDSVFGMGIISLGYWNTPFVIPPFSEVY